MSPTLARLFTSLFPRRWRKRYGPEFEALLETERGDVRTAANIVWSAAQERISPGAPEGNEEGTSGIFRSCCIRAPWAVFGIAPLLALAGAYFLACCYLWSGWQVFLPVSDTPFVGHRLTWFANAYFQLGKFYYFLVPVLVGWTIEFVAARHRARVAWPTVGVVLIAWMGAVARIQASRTGVRGGLGHINMNFAFVPTVSDIYGDLTHAFTILCFTALPYLFWRLGKHRSMPL